MNIGIIGIGYWGPNLVRNFYNNPKCKVTKVSDLRMGRLEYINNLFPDIKTTLFAEEILEDKEIDAVVVATPARTHKDIAIQAIKNNKHVFVEKPLTDNYQDAVELVEFARQNSKVLVVGHIFQFAPPVTSLKEYLNSELTGKPFHFSSQRINLGPPNAATDVVWDLAPHDLSILLYLFGENPDKITAFGESFWWKDVTDNAHIYLEFPSKRSAHIHVSWLSSNKTRKISIFCENGNFEYDETKPDENKVIFFDRGIDNRVNINANDKNKLQYGVGEVTKILLKKGEPLALEVDSFLDSIINSTEPINNGNIGKEVVRILEIASQSIKENSYA
jgi:predicted dehydrogenase